MILLTASLILICMLTALGLTGLSLRERTKLVASDAQNHTNLEAFEAQAKVLKEEKEGGLITQALYEQLARELERKLLGDVPDETPSTDQITPAIKPKILILAAVVCVMVAGLVYGIVFVDKAVWQRYQDISQYESAVAQSVNEGALVESLLTVPISRLAPILQSYALQDTQDHKRWQFLGQFFLSLDQAQLAELALKRAFTLTSDLDVGILYLQAKLKLNQGQLTEDSERVLRSLELIARGDPEFTLLQAAMFYQSERYEEAIRLWSSLVAQAPESLSESARQGSELIQGYIDSAKRKLAEQKNPAANVSPALKVAIEFSSVSLDSEGYLWVVAKNITDSGPPLAVRKLEMAAVRAAVSSGGLEDEFIYRLVLSEQDAMMPGLTISSQSDLVVKTMVSATGQLENASNDWVVTERRNWQTDESVIELNLARP